MAVQLAWREEAGDERSVCFDSDNHVAVTASGRRARVKSAPTTSELSSYFAETALRGFREPPSLRLFDPEPTSTAAEPSSPKACVVNPWIFAHCRQAPGDRPALTQVSSRKRSRSQF